MAKRQTTADLKMFGGYRADKHGKRERLPQSEDEPTPMAVLEGEALKLWEQVVPQLVALKTVSALDSAELTSLCIWWGEYRKWFDDTSQNAYKRTTAMAIAYKQFRTLAPKFYLTPSDRVGMPCGIQTLEGVRRRSHEAAQAAELEDLIS